jgi:transcriptional regulator with GAF, ATPase, and Fis domain
VDVQVVAATNEDPRELVQAGRFREDLLWRVMEVAVELPPLTGRLADIPHLAQGFFRAARERFGRTRLEGLSEAALHVLLAHDWSESGNIRGLENTIHRSVLLAAPEARSLEAEDIQFLHGMGPASRRTQPVALPGRPAPPAAAPAPLAAAPAAEADAPWRTSGHDHTRQRELLRRKIEQHGGVLTAVAADAELARALGHPAGSMPPSSLRLYVQRWKLDEAVTSARRRRKQALGQDCPDAAALAEAVRQHGSGTAAARALGLTRDVLVGRLRQTGQTIRQVLASEQPGQDSA